MCRLVPGSGLLTDLEDALGEAERIGYPVMVKATGGGGGIGIAPCERPDDLVEAFERVARLADSNFGNGGVFLERRIVRARHVEAQVLGDGTGGVVVLGDRDCSLQRRNQKVVEEAPAPNLPAAVRDVVRRTSERLCASVSYRSAGTVEFVYDVERAEAMFLEVNTRLQVEHPVTEQVYGIDLVACMLRIAAGDPDVVRETACARPQGVAIEARVCAEDPELGWRPGAGRITAVSWPSGVRVDSWVEPGTEVSSSYDSLLAKVIATASDRDRAIALLHDALERTVDRRHRDHRRRRGRGGADAGIFRRQRTTPARWRSSPTVRIASRSNDPGTQTTVQAWPGRQGYWDVGVPPSGPMDDLSFRWGNLALGNEEGAPGLEATLEGPALRFSAETTGVRDRRAGGGAGERCAGAHVGALHRRRGRDARHRPDRATGNQDLHPRRRRARRARVSRQRRHLHPGRHRRSRRAGAAGGGCAAACGRGRSTRPGHRSIRSSGRRSPTTGS